MIHSLAHFQCNPPYDSLHPNYQGFYYPLFMASFTGQGFGGSLGGEWGDRWRRETWADDPPFTSFPSSPYVIPFPRFPLVSLSARSSRRSRRDVGNGMGMGDEWNEEPPPASCLYVGRFILHFSRPSLRSVSPPSPPAEDGVKCGETKDTETTRQNDRRWTQGWTDREKQRRDGGHFTVALYEFHPAHEPLNSRRSCRHSLLTSLAPHSLRS